MIKRQFGFTKVAYKGLAKNTAKLHTLFMLGNLWMVRHRLRPHGGSVRVNGAPVALNALHCAD